MGFGKTGVTNLEEDLKKFGVSSVILPRTQHKKLTMSLSVVCKKGEMKHWRHAELQSSVEGISRKGAWNNEDLTREDGRGCFHDIMCQHWLKRHKCWYIHFCHRSDITDYGISRHLHQCENLTSSLCQSILVDWMSKETTMDNVNILLWITRYTTSRSCLISEAGIVQQNDSRWFHTESSSSMRFLVPRSRPLDWVIVKVQASNQDGPGWVTVQRLHSAVPRLSTAIHSCRYYVCVKITFHKALCLHFQDCGWLIKSGTCAPKSISLGSWTEFTGIHSLLPFSFKIWFTKLSGSCINGYLQEASALEATFCSPFAADLYTISLTFFYLFIFFGKACGWCWCQRVDMWFSQWLSVACWIDATGRPEVTTETTRLFN